MKEFKGAIGIDLGEFTTPSYVAFTKSGWLVGEPAKIRIAKDEENKIYDVKRFIGRKFTDKCVQNDIKRWPFKVIDRGDDTPVVEVKIGEETKTFTAEEISAEILEYMKEAAEKAVGNLKVEKAVISVPANFDNAQREATKKAGKLAGLEVLRIINEPTAAAIAYGCDRTNDNKKRNVLIFDFGGGTFDVSLLTIENGKYEVKATDGDTHLGGEDFDNLLVNFFKKVFLTKNPTADLQKNRLMKVREKNSCEELKRLLSEEEETELFIGRFYDGEDYEERITRAEFELLCDHLFRSTIPVIMKVLQDANMDKRDIEEIVLVGGSTRIPKIKSILSHFFDCKDLKQSINPDEAVAHGAALLAHEIYSNENKIVLNDVLSQTLSTDIRYGRVKHMIYRNTRVPVTEVKTFQTTVDNQTSVTIKVLEGDSTLIERCNLLGEFLFEGITPAPAGAVTIQLTYEVDRNGCVSVIAQEKNTDNIKTMIIHER